MNNFINICSIISIILIQLFQFICIDFNLFYKLSSTCIFVVSSAYQERRNEAEFRHYYWHFIRRSFRRGPYYHSTGTPLSEKEVARKTASFEYNAV